MLKIKSAFFILISIFSCSKKAENKDWANLNKYKAENLKLRNAAPAKNRVVFMGNSITEFWPKSFFTNKAYINRGISGQTTPQIKLRFKQDVIQLQPKIVVLLAGTNDIAGNTGPITLEEIRDNIIFMVDMAKENSIYPIVCSVLPAHEYPWKPGMQPNIKIPKLNRMLQEACKEKGILYLDYFSAMVDHRNGLPKDLAEDGVHPTEKGYAIMEQIVEKAIIKALKN